MKFWETEIFTTGLLCVLSADSSIGWCAVLAIFCLFGIIMQQFTIAIEEDKRKTIVKNSTGSAATESDAWVGHCQVAVNPTSDTSTIWEEWQ